MEAIDFLAVNMWSTIDLLRLWERNQGDAQVQLSCQRPALQSMTAQPRYAASIVSGGACAMRRGHELVETWTGLSVRDMWSASGARRVMGLIGRSDCVSILRSLHRLISCRCGE